MSTPALLCAVALVGAHPARAHGRRLFECTASAKQPEQVILQELAQLQQTGQASPALFLKGPYLLSFLDLRDGFAEKNFEIEACDE